MVLKMEQNKQHARLSGLDQFRLIAALMVIGIHTFPFSSVNKEADTLITLTLFRIAVPFFFMVTGYFLLGPYMKNPSYPAWWEIRKNIKSILQIYLFAIVLYLPLSFYNGTLHWNDSFIEMIKKLAIDGTFYHLWYFPAVILGLLLGVFLLTYTSQTIAITLSFLFYLIGLGGDSYYGLIREHSFFQRFYQGLFQISDFTRNGLFFGLFFLLLGALLSNYSGKRKHPSFIPLIISLILLLAESFFLHRQNTVRHDSMYLMLPLVMFYLFQVLLRWQPPLTIRRSADLALWLYLLHPFSIVLCYFLQKGLKLSILKNSLLHYLLVVLLTLFFCQFLFVFFKKSRLEKQVPLHRAQKVVKLTNLQHNYHVLQQQLSSKSKIMAVVKGNAYGHGAVQCSQALEKEGVDFFAVATLEEGLQLRRKGIQSSILILGYTDPQQSKKLRTFDLIQTVFNLEYAQQLNRVGIKIDCHLKIDTGMHRLGFAPNLQEILPVYQFSFLNIIGVYSHLGSADGRDQESIERTKQQINTFNQLLDQMRERQLQIGVTHLQSSYGLLNYPELDYDYVRLGIFLYGTASDKKNVLPFQLKPVLRVKAKLIAVREVAAGEYLGYGNESKTNRTLRLGTISIGYGDGISRSLSYSGFQLYYQDQPIPQVGRICMDMLLVDLTAIENISFGAVLDVVEDAERTAEESGTITNELFSRLGGRLESRFIQ